MTKHLESANSVSSNDTLENCSALPGIFQIAVGVLLATASAFVYGLMHHPALLIPAIMGTALLFSGARALDGMPGKLSVPPAPEQRDNALGICQH